MDFQLAHVSFPIKLEKCERNSFCSIHFALIVHKISCKLITNLWKLQKNKIYCETLENEKILYNWVINWFCVCYSNHKVLEFNKTFFNQSKVDQTLNHSSKRFTKKTKQLKHVFERKTCDIQQRTFQRKRLSNI